MWEQMCRITSRRNGMRLWVSISSSGALGLRKSANDERFCVSPRNGARWRGFRASPESSAASRPSSAPVTVASSAGLSGIAAISMPRSAAPAAARSSATSRLRLLAAHWIAVRPAPSTALRSMPETPNKMRAASALPLTAAVCSSVMSCSSRVLTSTP